MIIMSGYLSMSLLNFYRMESQSDQAPILIAFNLEEMNLRITDLNSVILALDSLFFYVIVEGLWK